MKGAYFWSNTITYYPATSKVWKQRYFKTNILYSGNKQCYFQRECAVFTVPPELNNTQPDSVFPDLASCLCCPLRTTHNKTSPIHPRTPHPHVTSPMSTGCFILTTSLPQTRYLQKCTCNCSQDCWKRRARNSKTLGVFIHVKKKQTVGTFSGWISERGILRYYKS